jgi:hypothetical protein
MHFRWSNYLGKSARRYVFTTGFFASANPPGAERIQGITKRPFDKLRVTKEKGSRIRGVESKSAKFKV